MTASVTTISESLTVRNALFCIDYEPARTIFAHSVTGFTHSVTGFTHSDTGFAHSATGL
jgi:hypothetical protein